MTHRLSQRFERLKPHRRQRRNEPAKKTHRHGHQHAPGQRIGIDEKLQHDKFSAALTAGDDARGGPTVGDRANRVNDRLGVVGRRCRTPSVNGGPSCIYRCMPQLVLVVDPLELGSTLATALLEDRG